MKYVIIGAGISGLAISNILQQSGNKVVVFESESCPGGMIRCDVVEGNLFYRTGGHVFNTKRQDVLEWFWKHFDKNQEFVKADRNASISMSDGKMIPYPIENHAYLLDDFTMKSFIGDLINNVKNNGQKPDNFEDFLQARFGETLYRIYFQPYNFKVWRRDLTQVPLSWLDGKLPMPTVEEIIYNNFNHIKERAFVHSSFFYPKKGGSQFIADRLAGSLNIIYNSPVEKIFKSQDKWIVNGAETDRVIYCGNIKFLPKLLNGQIDILPYEKHIEKLESHGTTSVFCEIARNNYSWVYMPSEEHESHRIICTGNFAESNNATNKLTGTIEFTDKISKEDILNNLSHIPFSPKYLTHNYEKYTYPIQNVATRAMIQSLKQEIEKNNLYLLGRFAEWEYYNMDVAIGTAIDLYRNKIYENSPI